MSRGISNCFIIQPFERYDPRRIIDDDDNNNTLFIAIVLV